jgi:hypothetical protein
MTKNKVFFKKVIGVLSLLVFSFSFGAPLLITVNIVEANDNSISLFPYTRYYTCGNPGTNSYGVVHTETGTDKYSYYIDAYNPNPLHYDYVDSPFPNAPAIPPPDNQPPPAVLFHISHPVDTHLYEETVEYIHLDRYHWRCR